ncbi:DUF2199 domain-containing protein [Primorskyibacter sp. S87]|uniref:DUF2199 domain-containing protein n=1 Tax=Primorskyibacter sp. S87 TaxID=3415126 RepID=UPI003C7CCAE4
MDAHISRLLTGVRTCRCCGASFRELLNLDFDRPGICPLDLPVLDNSALLGEFGDVLTQDFCRLDESRFIRGQLVLPIRSAGAELVLGIWVQLSPDAFEHHVTASLMGGEEALEAMEGWLANPLPVNDEGPVACLAHLAPGAERPEFQITEADHPLTDLQQDEMPIDSVFEWLHAFGHDVGSLIFDA